MIKMVKNRDNKGINLAVNHIHYGTLKISREVKDMQSMVSKGLSVNTGENKAANRFEKECESDQKSKTIDIWLAERNFIMIYASFVDDWILKQTLKAIEFYINRALFQIHFRGMKSVMDS